MYSTKIIMDIPPPCCWPCRKVLRQRGRWRRGRRGRRAARATVAVANVVRPSPSHQQHSAKIASVRLAVRRDATAMGRTALSPRCGRGALPARPAPECGTMLDASWQQCARRCVPGHQTSTARCKHQEAGRWHRLRSSGPLCRRRAREPDRELRVWCHGSSELCWRCLASGILAWRRACSCCTGTAPTECECK